MKNKIITCINVDHSLYEDSFKSNKIKLGKSYKCVDELELTAAIYRITEFASLKGVTIRSHVDKWGWKKPCLPKECFRIATKTEILKYKIILLLNMPFRYMKILFFKTLNRIDRIVRKRHYDELYEEFY